MLLIQDHAQHVTAKQLMKNKSTPLLDALIFAVREYCAARRGRVSELAAALGVMQPQVSLWLNGKAEPSGEITLMLQQWLAEEKSREAQAAAAAPVVPDTAPPRLAAALAFKPDQQPQETFEESAKRFFKK